MKFVSCGMDSKVSSRPPHGGRGLKCDVAHRATTVQQSPPTRGAWIEICGRFRGGVIGDVAPHTGGVD